MSVETLNELMSVVIILLLAALSGFLMALLKQKVTEITQKIENNTFQKRVGLASDAVLQAVETISQTYVEDLKAAKQFDAEAHKVAKDKALALTKKLLTEKTRNIITEAYSDCDTWLESKIEQMVYELDD